MKKQSDFKSVAEYEQYLRMYYDGIFVCAILQTVDYHQATAESRANMVLEARLMSKELVKQQVNF